MCCVHVVFSCFIFMLYEIFVACVVLVLYACCKKNKNRKTKMRCCIFPRVERVLIFCVIFFRARNALWQYCVVLSAHGTRSDVIVLYFPRVERTLSLLCYIFFAFETYSGVIVLYFPYVKRNLSLLCYIFPFAERAV